MPYKSKLFKRFSGIYLIFLMRSFAIWLPRWHYLYDKINTLKSSDEEKALHSLEIFIFVMGGQGLGSIQNTECLVVLS